MNKNRCLRSVLSVDCYWKASKWNQVLQFVEKYEKNSLGEFIYYVRWKVKKKFFKEIYSCRRDIKALFQEDGINIHELGLINFREMGLSFAKMACIGIDPLTTNIAIYNDSLTLISVIFTTFLHFARTFSEGNSKRKKIFNYFLLCLCKRIVSGPIFLYSKFLQFESKTRENYFI